MNELIPISIMSFNRPHYLRQLLESLKYQVDDGYVQYHLFQDNSVNYVSNKRYCDDEKINRCCDCFAEFFPCGIKHIANRNVGVALNYSRAFSYVFEECNYKYGIFVEDDVVLNYYYIKLMRKLLNIFDNRPLVGMVTAKGVDPKKTITEQRNQRRMLSPFGSFLAVGIYRDRWLAIKPFFNEYISIIKERDYRNRPKKELIKFYNHHGMYCNSHNLVSSQDRAREFGMLKNNQIFLSTMTNNLRYIGRNGIHTDGGVFKKLGFENMIVYDNYFDDFEIPSDMQLQRFIDDRLYRFGINKQ